LKDAYILISFRIHWGDEEKAAHILGLYPEELKDLGSSFTHPKLIT
jgi:hypothetical protein